MSKRYPYTKKRKLRVRSQFLADPDASSRKRASCLVPPLSYIDASRSTDRSSSDYSLLHSLASIHLDSSDNKMTPPQSRRHSTNDNCQAVSGTRVCGASSRRGTMGDPPFDEDRPCPTSVHSSKNRLDLKVPPAPPLPFDTPKPPSAKNEDSKDHPKRESKLYCSRRDDYTLGEKARSFSHMMDAIRPQSVYQLKNG
eukprot:scaffold176605_cov60-Cyclotella_meneghiniana.AAC.3